MLNSHSFQFPASTSNKYTSCSFSLFAYFQLFAFTANVIWFSFIPLNSNYIQKFINYLLLANLMVSFESCKQNIVLLIIISFWTIPSLASRKLHYFYCPSTSLIIFITFFYWLPFLLLFVECYLCLNFLYFLRFSLPLHGFNSYLYVNAYQRPL